MKKKLALIQMDLSFGQPEKNRKRATEMISQAAQQGADIVVLPEMWTTGYDLERFADIAESLDGPTHQLLRKLSIEHSVTIIGSIAEKDMGTFYNTLVAYDQMGQRLVRYRKAHLFRLMREEKFLSPGNEKGNFLIDGLPTAGVICYDIRFPEWLRTHMLDGSRALFVVAEWPKPRVDHWRHLLISRAIENQCFVIACNRVGHDPDNEFGGHSLVIDPWGKVVAEAGTEQEVLFTEVDFDQVEEIREQIPIFQDRRPDLYT